MVINRCWNCMEELGGQGVCPHCGFDRSRMEIPPFALKPDTILHGKYLVGNVLGQGGFGITYIGFDITLELKVAIKEYFPFSIAGRNNSKSNSLSWNDNENQNENWSNGCSDFLSEARKMAKINSIPEIVSVRDTFEENKTAYIVMDYVPGVTLKDYVRRNGRLSFSECVELLLPIIDGLDKVHRQGLIHRDISPDNLMLTPNGKLYLLDLGAAKDMNKDTDRSELVTKKGFSPIEQYTNDGVIGAWTDVYALAASIYYCVYGKVVPPAVDRLEHDALDFSGKVKVPLTAEQIAVLQKGLAVRKEVRYQSAVDFLVALKDVIRVKKYVPKKRIAIISGAAATAVAEIAIICILAATTPWLPKVESVGCSNMSLFSGSYYSKIDKEYQYFTDLDGALQIIPYDEENDAFYVTDSQIIYEQDDNIEKDSVGCLNLSENKLYAIYFGGEDNSNYLIEMNHDGSEARTLLEIENDCGALQYVKLSNGKEYLYYQMSDGSSEEDALYYLYRYDLRRGRAEKVLADSVEWYNVHEKYVYYTVYNEEADPVSQMQLKRAALNGQNPKLLDDTHGFVFGCYEGDRLYMVQVYDETGSYKLALVPCTDEGKPVEEGEGNFDSDWMMDEQGTFNMQWTIGGGWIFYSRPDSKELYRMRLDGSSKSMICSGYNFNSLSYYNNYIYFRDGYYDETEEFIPTQLYLAYEDGSSVVSFDLESENHLTTENGIEYTISQGEVKMIGYIGEDTDVVIPNEIDGYPVNENVDKDKFSSDVLFYKTIYDSELTYTSASDGITITGYNGEQTGTYPSVAIPSEIDGTAVVKIGDGAFAECEFTNLYLPSQCVEIGEEAFSNCSNLNHVVFSDTLTVIHDSAFEHCPFEGEDIRLPDGFEELGSMVFFGCNPNSVYFPASFHSAPGGFMTRCGGTYIVDPDNELYKSVDGVFYSKDGKTLFAYPTDRTESFTVPDGVDTIWNYAFYACSVEGVTIPEGVTTIGKAAFRYCENFSSAVIPQTVTEIETEAFLDTALTSVKINKDCVVGEEAFESGVEIQYY